jgi:hypothetical protein
MKHRRIKVKLKILLILFIVILPQGVFAQTNFGFGLELGFSFITQKEENSTFLLKSLKVSPLFSPLIGIYGNVKICKSFKIKLAMQYNKVGYILPFDRTLGNQPYKIYFNKLCIPISVDISPETTKINPSIILGWRPNILLSGNLLIDPWSNDLFSIDNPPNRITNQFFWGFSVCFQKKLAINFSHYIGQTISVYVKDAYFRGNWEGELKNSEFAISLTYLFSSKKAAN